MIDFLQEYVCLLTLGICLCVGYAIKNIDCIPNKFIPLALMLLGLISNIWVANCELALTDWQITPSIVLGGLCSGLASCKIYDLSKDKVEDLLKDKIENQIEK